MTTIMTQTVIDYRKMLTDSGVSRDAVLRTEEILAELPDIKAEFVDPSVSVEKKHNVIDRVFPREIRNVLKLLCDNNEFDYIDDVIEAYKEFTKHKTGKFFVTIFHVTPPTEEQLARIRDFIVNKFSVFREDIEIELKEDPSLIGGFVINAGGIEYDRSVRTRLREMRRNLAYNVPGTSSTDEIISILKEEISQSNFDRNDREIGTVKWIGDGIVTIDGIDHAQYGEIVIFDTGIKGMVQDIRTDEIGCILFGKESGMREGTRAIRTGRRAGIPVGPAFLGRVIDALGAPIDDKGEIEAVGYRPI